MPGVSSPSRWLWAVAGLALAVRLGALALVEARNPGSIMAPDSYGYQQLARTLLHEGRFAAAADAPAHTRRTPLFPALIAAVYLVAGESPRAVVRLGTLLGVLTVVLAALVAHRLGGAIAGGTAGVLLALDTASIAAGLRMLTETPFTLWLVAGVAAAVSFLHASHRRPARAALLGAFLAAAALTRPIGLLLVLPAGAWLVLCGRARGWGFRPSAEAVAAFVLPWLLIVGGWQVRNRLAAGTYAPSDGPARFLLFSRGGDIVAQRDGITFQEARKDLARSIAAAQQRTGIREDSLYLRPALELIARHPLRFLWTQVRWLPELLLGTGAAPLAGSMGLETMDGAGRPVIAVLRIASVAHLLFVYAAVAWAAWGIRAASDERRLVLALLGALALYFVILSTGPQTYSRFRAPFMPLLAIGAGLGVERWWRATTARRGSAAAP